MRSQFPQRPHPRAGECPEAMDERDHDDERPTCVCEGLRECVVKRRAELHHRDTHGEDERRRSHRDQDRENPLAPDQPSEDAPLLRQICPALGADARPNQPGQVVAARTAQERPIEMCPHTRCFTGRRNSSSPPEHRSRYARTHPPHSSDHALLPHCKAADGIRGAVTRHARTPPLHTAARIAHARAHPSPPPRQRTGSPGAARRLSAAGRPR
jgi:hypothetical protein